MVRSGGSVVAIEGVLAPNPGPMTLTGTQSYVLSAADAAGENATVVVDPGPLEPAHLATLAERPVALILITHRHPDHTEAAFEFARMTGAEVRAADPEFCTAGNVLRDGEVVQAAGIEVGVIATPGHTSDSVCFALNDGSEHGAMLTGDTILGRGTSVIAHPDGSLGDYLASLEKLREYGPATVYPAHGPAGAALDAISDAYLSHREERLHQVRAARARLGAAVSVAELRDAVYGAIEPRLHDAAEASLRAQLEYLDAAEA